MHTGAIELEEDRMSCARKDKLSGVTSLLQTLQHTQADNTHIFIHMYTHKQNTCI